ncbi:hypothetical protein B0H10DRAFT_2369576 [Mycena sp. CBHHK59/15]|nr:hypothetical protein B0H10DRAFT_2369576 [Mycena sp. CBHHK59/15]
MPKLLEFRQHWEETPFYGQYLIQIFSSSVFCQIPHAEAEITLGDQYFELAEQLEKAKWYNALGHYYRFSKNDMEKALDCHKLALGHSTSSPNTVGRKILCDISTVMALTGKPVDAQIHATKAQEYAECLGDLGGQTRALYIQALCSRILGDFQEAIEFCQEARTVLTTCGLGGGALDLSILVEEAEVHVLKTEYMEAQHIHESIASIVAPGQPPKYNSTISKVNLRLIHIATGTQLDLVGHDLDAAKDVFKTSFAYPLGVLYCDMAYADLHLRQGLL